MSEERQIRMDLVKLADGTRLLRISEPGSGLCLEKKLDPGQPVIQQKERLRKAFDAVLLRELTPIP